MFNQDTNQNQNANHNETEGSPLMIHALNAPEQTNNTGCWTTVKQSFSTCCCCLFPFFRKRRRTESHPSSNYGAIPTTSSGPEMSDSITEDLVQSSDQTHKDSVSIDEPPTGRINQKNPSQPTLTLMN